MSRIQNVRFWLHWVEGILRYDRIVALVDSYGLDELLEYIYLAINDTSQAEITVILDEMNKPRGDDDLSTLQDLELTIKLLRMQFLQADAKK